MRTDVCVVGGGPTGCTVATLLARAGRRVTIVEREPQACRVVGESLLPAGNRVLELLGISLEGFQVKRGAVFTCGERAARIDFRDAAGGGWQAAHQVPRELFDARLREAAREAGVTFLAGRAENAELQGHGESPRLQTSAGPVDAEWLIDAGGRQMFLARQLGLRRPHPALRSAALVRYYRGVRPLAPYEPGDIVAAAFEGGWFWMIPFANGEWSVGVVTARDADMGPDRWAEALRRCGAARERLEGAVALGPVAGVQDFTAHASTFSGDGWALAGDAALFLDPIFSSGVLLGLESGARLATHLLAGTLAAYEAEFRRAAGLLERIVLAYYDRSFLDVVLAPKEPRHERHRRAIIALLSGAVFDPVHPDALAIAERLPQVARYLRTRSTGEALTG
jgi:flavin-dependent dehydrogenase